MIQASSIQKSAYVNSVLPNSEKTYSTAIRLKYIKAYFTDMLIHAGIPIADVSTQLGHASIDITLRTYTHLFTDASTASRRISDYIDRTWHQNGHQNE